MIGPDPLETVWGALDDAGYGPHGPLHDFRARCPGHEGENRDALRVTVGADGRALLHCFRGCEPDQIVRALGLQWRDVFPAGHRHHRRRARPRPKPRGAMEIVLDGFLIAGIPVRGMWIADRCPLCGSGGLWLRMTPDGQVDAECADGCTRHEVLSALETLVAIEEAKAEEARHGDR